jgi:superfamily II DNA or RNA helicase
MQLLVRRPDTGYLDANLWVPKTHCAVEGVKRALTFQFFNEQQVTLLTLWKETEHHLIVPREFWDPKDFAFPVVDLRPARFTKVAITSRVKLDHEFEDGALRPTGKTVQHEAMAALLRARGGILQLACGLGKTVVALDYIARRGFPAIIILDTTELMRQWREEIEEHLDIPGGVGLIQGDTRDWKKSVVLATYHSLSAWAPTMPEEVRRWFGTAIWDEAHHVAAPVFSRSADVFYGVRLGLTATPDRDDGYHVVYNFHLGPVIYKNLTQDLKPRIYFTWTGLGLDENDPRVQAAARDCNGELHIGKIAGFLGSWPARIDFVLNQVRMAIANDRKVLVLSKSVDALVNLVAAWNGQAALISDIPFPDAAAVGETVPPAELSAPNIRALTKQLFTAIADITRLNASGDTAKAQHQIQKKANIEFTLEAHRVYKKCEALWNKQRAAYLKALLAVPSTAGLMIYKVKPEERARMLREKQVTFAVSKYGREGLNERSLDTIIMNEPLSSRNALQQLMGRVLRKKKGKQEPVVVFFEDDIGPFIGMCRKLRSHLSEWSHDEGGPFTFENVGYENAGSGKKRSSWKSSSTATFASRTTTIRAPGS